MGIYIKFYTSKNTDSVCVHIKKEIVQWIELKISKRIPYIRIPLFFHKQKFGRVRRVIVKFCLTVL